MRRRERETVLPTLAAMLLASTLVHLLLWPAADHVVGLQWGGPSISIGGGVMEVALLPMPGREDDPEEEETPPPPEPDPEDTPLGKLVKLEWLEHQERPEDARYLSEFDSRVDRQTKTPVGRERPGAPARPPGDRPDAQNVPQPVAPRSNAPALPLSPARDLSGEGRSAPAPEVSRGDRGELGASPGPAGGGVPGLRGSPDAMRQALGSMGSFDDLRELEEGDGTFLNSRRWRFASFFNRVRNQVAQHWQPETLHAARDPEGRIHGTKTRITRLIIALHPDGSLAGIVMEQPSGVDYLDEEAIRAVRAAAPFANPPPQLVDPARGRIEFGFGFIFEIRGGRRIFRYRR